MEFVNGASGEGGAKRRMFVSDAVRLSGVGHFPVPTSQRRCGLCVAQKRTRWMCSLCQIPLCRYNHRDCFKVYHTEAKLP